MFIGRMDAEAEAPVLWPPEVKDDSLEKTWMLGKVEGKTRRGWHHQCSEHQLGQTLGDGEGQGGLASAVHGVMKSQT